MIAPSGSTGAAGAAGANAGSITFYIRGTVVQNGQQMMTLEALGGPGVGKGDRLQAPSWFGLILLGGWLAQCYAELLCFMCLWCKRFKISGAWGACAATM